MCVPPGGERPSSFLQNQWLVGYTSFGAENVVGIWPLLFNGRVGSVVVALYSLPPFSHLVHEDSYTTSCIVRLTCKTPGAVPALIITRPQGTHAHCAHAFHRKTI